MIVREEEPAPELSMGAMVLGEKAQLARMKLFNATGVEEDVPKGEASSKTNGTGVKQGSSLMVVDGEVNEVPTRLLVDTGATQNFLAKEEAKALGVKFTRVDGEMKAINSKATPVYGRAWGVPVRFGKWKGKVDFLVVDLDDVDVVLGMEFILSVAPFKMDRDVMTITHNGCKHEIKLAKGEEGGARLASMKAWWALGQKRQRLVRR
uniref:Uncharacterized protein n=1 Tax=Chenopodium quinoa TaxID=63459 RepID=A0A803N251_CHEQI